MLKFLKKLLKKEEPKQKIELPLDKLKGFFNDGKTRLMAEISKNIEEFEFKIKEEVQITKINIERLKDAKLRNPNIPIKEIHFMEGNRDSYIKKAVQFIDSITIEKDLSKLSNSFADFESRINSFGASTYRPYSILQHFFGEETNLIASNIKKIEDFFKKVMHILKRHDFENILVLEKEIDDLSIKIGIKKTLENSILKVNKTLEILNKEIKDLDRDLDKARNSKEYKEYLELKTKIEVTREKMMNQNMMITHPFSIIEQALKKYSRIALENEKLCLDYLNNPVKSLLEDENLKILVILNKIKENLINDKITLKDKKKDKTVETIEMIDEGFIKNFIDQRNEIKKEILGIDGLLINNNIVNRLSELEKEISHNKDKINKVNWELDDLSDKNSKIIIETLIKSIEEKTKILLNQEIHVILGSH